MTRLTLLVLAFVILCQYSLVSAIDRVEYVHGNDIKAEQWDVTDVVFHSDGSSVAGLKQTFSATFSHETADSISVDGFYDGESDYVIRFTPPASGKWTFITQSSLAELNDHQGTLNATPAVDGRKGGVLVNPASPRSFIHENGDRYYPIAFEVDWLFALDAENADDIPETRKIVDGIAENGFNQVVMNVFAYDVNWKKDERLDPQFDYGSPQVFPFLGTNENPDYSALQIQYFQRLDRVIDYLDKQGIVAHLMIYVWNKGVAWPPANSAGDNLYFDYVTNRYQAFPNLVWDISKEALGYGHTDVEYITSRIERLRKNDAYDRLITVHDYGYCRKFPEQVDFVSVQLWKSELYGVMRDVCKAISGKPILNIEHGGYERGPYVVFTGNYTSPEVCLERAYQCVFAGTFPTHYWQGAAWNVVIPDFEKLPSDERPRLDYYRHLRQFVDRFQVEQLIVDDQKSNAGFCLHNNQGLYLYYVPRECDFLGIRPPRDRGNVMKFTWFDPFTGKYESPFETKLSQWPAVEVPAGDQFRILVMEVGHDKTEP
ncbi:MAG: DUF5060 domain-containing protein [Pirellulaceae bacterium]